ncbi:hypothetical protein BKA66DRAFT_428362 [Pyrenochaeta sp. MPI-SDFR-AT-0127]|nr:hypothetical protein BKA66DRAFT_428362 [Pyrenochaeta sp. MPI-SDFR-AT-0127]
MATTKKIIVVIGGTGMFGGAVLTSLLDNPNFHVRSTTRDASTERAQRLRDQGAEVIQADSWSAQELVVAFKGAWGLFLNTDSDSPTFKPGPDQEPGPPEFEMGKIVIDAAVKQGVKMFVFSGLPEASNVTSGAVPITSFDNKAEITRYSRQAGFESAVTITAGWTMDIFFMDIYTKTFGGFATVPDQEGYLTLKLPPFGSESGLVPWTSCSDDFGDAVHGIFLNPMRYNGQSLWAISCEETFAGVTEIFNQVSGTKKARYIALTDQLTSKTAGKTKEVNGLMNYCQYVKGLYCDGKPVDQSVVKVLKANATAARGRSESDAQLQTVEGFFKKRLGT